MHVEYSAERYHELRDAPHEVPGGLTLMQSLLAGIGKEIGEGLTVSAVGATEEAVSASDQMQDLIFEWREDCGTCGLTVSANEKDDSLDLAYYRPWPENLAAAALEEIALSFRFPHERLGCDALVVFHSFQLSDVRPDQLLFTVRNLRLLSML